MTITLPSDPDLYEPATLEALFAPLGAMDNAIIDFREAPYVTSAVLSALISLHRERSASGLPALRIICNSSFVRRILRAVEFDEMFPIVDSLDEAMADVLKSRDAAWGA